MRAQVFLLSATFGAFLGCEGEPQPLPQGAPSGGDPTAWAGGSRLLIRSVVPEAGGQGRALGLIDSQIDQPCYLVGSGGEDTSRVFCTPNATGPLGFIDSTCTDPIIQTHATDAVWVSELSFHTTGRVFAIGERVQSTATYYRIEADGSCTPFYDDVPAFQIVEEVSPSELAGGVLVEHSQDGMVRTQFEGDDGSFWSLGLMDETSGAWCTPAEGETGAVCRPEKTEVVDEGLRDESCERLYVAEYGDIKVADVLSDGDFVQTYRFTRLDREVTVYRRLEDGTCEPVADFSLGRKTLYAGDAYPRSDWPVLTPQPEAAGRLTTHPVQLPSGGHAGFTVGWFDDRERGELCRPAWTAAGLRCLPTDPKGALAFAAFADEECTEPAFALREGFPVPRRATLIDYLAPPREAGIPNAEVVEIQGRLSTAFVHNFKTGQCERATRGFDAYRVGAVLPAEELAPLSIAIE